MKAILKLGHTDYVLEVEDATKIMVMLENAEVFQAKYRPKEEGGYLYYAYQKDQAEGLPTMQLVPDYIYNMAKLAGKPEA